MIQIQLSQKSLLGVILIPIALDTLQELLATLMFTMILKKPQQIKNQQSRGLIQTNLNILEQKSLHLLTPALCQLRLFRLVSAGCFTQLLLGRLCCTLMKQTLLIFQLKAVHLKSICSQIWFKHLSCIGSLLLLALEIELARLAIFTGEFKTLRLVTQILQTMVLLLIVTSNIGRNTIQDMKQIGLLGQEPTKEQPTATVLFQMLIDFLMGNLPQKECQSKLSPLLTKLILPNGQMPLI